MNNVPTQYLSFDDKATLAMGAAFDQAWLPCRYGARARRDALVAVVQGLR